MNSTDKYIWIMEDVFEDAGVSLTDRLFLFYLKEVSKPHGIMMNWRWITSMFAETEEIIKRLDKVIIEGRIQQKVRKLPGATGSTVGAWWFPERCSEVLGTYFYPKVKKHREAVQGFLQCRIPLSDVPDFYWRGLEKLPPSQIKTSKNELIRLINSMSTHPTV